MKKKPVIFLVLAPLLALLAWAASPCTHGSHFCLHKIRSPLAFHPEWEVSSIAGEADRINEALSQRYTYLGNGAQCYAFVSADGKYVLKFFKMKHLLPKMWLNVLPGSILEEYRAKKVEARAKRLKGTFGAFKMAYEGFKEESGLLLVHLNPTQSLHKQVCLSRGEEEWRVDLDQLPFLLQERAELIYTRLNRLMVQGDRDELNRSISSVFSFLNERDNRGFIDTDSGVSGNFGFVGERVIQLDVGRLQRKEGASKEEMLDARRAEAKLRKWAEERGVLAD